ncbi:MAG: moderate conductance mechanosensitive channel [Abditibacteriota bacterium]|nr:moderate conductance mechanosensitive channel [Abditibacteriota bacterium]
MSFRNLIANNLKLENLVFTALHVIFIAIVFEFLAWWLGRRIDRWVTPVIPADSGREHHWRTRRRTLLRQTPKLITRSLCYTIAVILVFEVFGVPVLPLSIGVGAIVLLFGSAFLPLLRDAGQGYALLAEDTLAPGDVVQIGEHRGTIEKLTLRGVWLRDEGGCVHALSNRSVQDVIVLQRNQESVSTDELMMAPAKSARPGTASATLNTPANGARKPLKG